MMKHLLSGMCGWALFAALGCHGAEAGRPDCLGIRPGMTVAEARERLQRYDPKLEVKSVELSIPQLSEKPVLGGLMVARLPEDPHQGGFPTETIQVSFTLPPNPPVVWKVFRAVQFGPGRQPTKTALLTALREKYGQEGTTVGMNPLFVSLYWMRGADGTPLEGKAAQECAAFCQAAYEGSFGLESLGKPSTDAPRSFKDTPLSATLAKLPPQCAATSYVVATLSLCGEGELVSQMRVAVIDAALDGRAREATSAVIQAAEAKAAKQHEKAKQVEMERAKGRELPKL